MTRRVTKAELQEAVRKVEDLCDLWDRQKVYLPADPQKLAIAPVYQIRQAISGVVQSFCSCAEPKLGERMNWDKPRCGRCNFFVKR